MNPVFMNYALDQSHELTDRLPQRVVPGSPLALAETHLADMMDANQSVAFSSRNDVYCLKAYQSDSAQLELGLWRFDEEKLPTLVTSVKTRARIYDLLLSQDTEESDANELDYIDDNELDGYTL